ncbi:hypothetical protein J4401_02565 [Candidatus Woesearchaeota archaeon]|nr:hypothetical protein [Candidatus Woesearchaeota archaeon]
MHVLGTPWRNLTYVVLTTEEGIKGYGESRVVGRTHSVVQLLRDTEHHFIGHSAHDIETLYQRFTLDDFNVPGSGRLQLIPYLKWLAWMLKQSP